MNLEDNIQSTYYHSRIVLYDHCYQLVQLNEKSLLRALDYFARV